MFIFNLNVVFELNFLKIMLSRVRFSPGFPPGAGFSREEFVPKCFYEKLLSRTPFPWRLLQRS
jgi:hypothetical protein